jgi:CelD/BcsL family acetyltransferase involved in cellulose biosynthesis
LNRKSARRSAFSGNAHVRTGIALEEIRSLEGLDALANEWLALADHLRVELPFSDFRWMAAWWRNLRRENRWTRDALCVLAVRRDGRLIAVAPYMITSRHLFRLPLLRVMQPIGTDPNITEVRCLLVAPEDEKDVTEAILAYACESVDCDAIVFSGLRADGEAVADLAASSHVVDATSVSMFVLPLAPTWDELRGSLPRNLRESLRKCRNSLARDNHNPTFKVIEDEREIIASLPRFFELHRNRADATETVQHGDVFARESSRAFIADAVRQFAPAGRMRLFTMEIEGAVVAMRLAYVCNDCLFLYYSGYDVAWGKYSVMTSVTSEAIQYAIASGLKRVNFSTGADQSKLRWRPEEIVTRKFVVQKPTIRARVGHQAVEAGKSMRAKWEKRQKAKRAATVLAAPPPSSPV